MKTLQIEIVNPKARRLIKELVDLKLIAIKPENPTKSFAALLKKLRSKQIKPSAEEIAREVESIRKKRHGKKG